MFALIYLSQANFPFSIDQLSQLEDQASQNNERLNITGYLSYQKGKFLQYLEGNREVVLELMSIIEQDSRHAMLRKVNLAALEEQRFPDWHMRYLQQHEITEIGLEQTLEDVLLHMSTSLYGDDRVQRITTRLIDSMARLYRGRNNNRPNSPFSPGSSKK